MDHQLALTIATVLFSAGVAWGVTSWRIKRVEGDVKEVKQNYIDRFNRLEEIERESLAVLRGEIRRIFDRMDIMLTKEDHDRICKFASFNNPQGR